MIKITVRNGFVILPTCLSIDFFHLDERADPVNGRGGGVFWGSVQLWA